MVVELRVVKSDKVPMVTIQVLVAGGKLIPENVKKRVIDVVGSVGIC
jgi:hypothetical protein